MKRRAFLKALGMEVTRILYGLLIYVILSRALLAQLGR